MPHTDWYGLTVSPPKSHFEFRPVVGGTQWEVVESRGQVFPVLFLWCLMSLTRADGFEKDFRNDKDFQEQTLFNV